MFTRDEFLMLEELLSEEISKRVDSGEYDYFSGDKSVLEGLLLKVRENIN